MDVRLTHDRRTRLATLGAGVGTLALFAYCLANAFTRIHGNTGDFPAFYNAARALLDGTNIYQTGFPDYIYPPLLAFLYAPLGLLSAPVAAALLLAGIGSAFAAGLWIGSRELLERFGIDATPATQLPVVFYALLLSLDKVRGELQMWQTNSILLLLFALALRWLDRRPAGAGTALALAFHIKYIPLVFLPYLVLRQRWRTLGAFLIAVPLLALLPALLVGWETNLAYHRTAFRGLLRLIGLDIGNEAAANIDPLVRSPISLSITSALSRILGPDVPNALTFGLALVLALAVTAGIAYLYRRVGVPFLYRPDGQMPGSSVTRLVVGFEWTALLMAFVLFSPQSNSRHFSMLVLGNALAVVCLRHGLKSVSRWPLLAGTTLFLLGSILPLSSYESSNARRFWVEISGIAWCGLVMLVSLAWTVLEETRRRNAALPVSTAHDSIAPGQAA